MAATAGWRFIQQIGATTASTNSLAKQFGSNITTGNRLFACIAWTTAAVINSVTDSAGNVWTLLATDANGPNTAIYSAPVTAGGGTQPTVTVAFSGNVAVCLRLLEYSGLSTAAGTGGLDATSSAHGNSNSATPGAAVVGSGAHGNELAITFSCGGVAFTGGDNPYGSNVGQDSPGALTQSTTGLFARTLAGDALEPGHSWNPAGTFGSATPWSSCQVVFGLATPRLWACREVQGSHFAAVASGSPSALGFNGGGGVLNGDRLLAIVNNTGGTAAPSSVTDSKGNAYTLLDSQLYDGGAAKLFIYQAPMSAATAQVTLTVQFAAATTFDVIFADYYNVTATIDTTAVGTGSSTTPDSTAAHVNETDELAVGVIAVASGLPALSNLGAWLQRDEQGFNLNAFLLEADSGASGGTADLSATLSGSEPWIAEVMLLQVNKAPLAPTLGPPANGAYVDTNAGWNAQWTYNPDSGSGTQNAAALRKKVSGGGSYSYFNVSTGLFQSTIVWNTTAQQSISIPAGLMADATTYNWSVATQENKANLQGPFAADATLNGSLTPVATVTGPSGTTTTSEPPVTWTDTLDSLASQTAYRVVIYSQAQYQAGGFSPGVSAGVWDSGVVNAATKTATPSTPLPQGIYRAYVQVTETGGQTSAWAFSGFTVAYDVPATPALTATYDSTTNRVVLTLQGQDNMLTQNQGSLETDTTGWAANVNCAIARTTAQALDGLASLQLTSTAGGDMSAITPTGLNGTAVQPSTQYTALASFRTSASVRAVHVDILWYTAAGALISTSTGASVNDAANGWVTASITTNSPANAAFAAVRAYVVAAGAANEVHYVDEISLAPGSSTQWFRGGLTGLTNGEVQYSDDGGNTWADVRGLSSVALPAGTQQAVGYDYEAPNASSREYRALVSASV